MSVIFFTDGSTKNNGYKNASGGFGIVCIDKDNNKIYQYQEFKSPTTNNEMELMAILKALQYIKEHNINFPKPIIYTDSAYSCNLINTWMYNWERNGWKRPKNQEVKNLEIIKQIYELANLADIKKVPGHNGIYWNEYVDKLAKGEIKI